MTTLIKRNSTIPIQKSETFSTASDNQTAVDIHVLQGERPMATHNMTLGRFRLDGVPPAPRGIPQIDVSFDINADGILTVNAVDKATGKEQNVTITASTNLNQSEIDNMVSEAEKFAGEDEQRKEVIEARNLADNLVYQTEKTLRELGDKIDGTVRADVEGKVNDVKDALKSDDHNRIKVTSDALQQALSQIGQAMYQDAGTPPGADMGGQPPPSNDKDNDDDVVEGEFTQA